jgi:hypothetical protein
MNPLTGKHRIKWTKEGSGNKTLTGFRKVRGGCKSISFHGQMPDVYSEYEKTGRDGRNRRRWRLRSSIY